MSERGENRVKCPVCDKDNKSMLCPNCGFDASREYERYPTFGAVGKAPAVSALRRKWETKQQKLIPEPPRKKKPWLAIAACAVALALGIGIGAGLGGGKTEPAEPKNTEQMQKPVETTLPPELTIPLDTTIPPETTLPSEPTEPLDPWETNILRSDKLAADSNDNWKDSVFGSQYRREEIMTVTFLDTLDDMPGDAWDVSAYRNGKVMAWVKPRGDFYDLYIGAEGGVWANRNCEELFSGYGNVIEFIFSDAFHTEYVTNMNDMFMCCCSLTSLDLSSFDTTSVWDMSYMFAFSNYLTALDLSSFDTSEVTRMYYMFDACTSLTDLKLGDRFVTTKANTMEMFKDCPAGDDYQHLLN